MIVNTSLIAVCLVTTAVKAASAQKPPIPRVQSHVIGSIKPRLHVGYFTRTGKFYKFIIGSNNYNIIIASVLRQFIGMPVHIPGKSEKKQSA